MDNEIKSILEPQEQVVWQGVISRAVMTFYLIISLAIVAGISFFLFSKDIINATVNGNPTTISGFTLGIVVLGIGLIFSLLVFLSNFVKFYTITNKRVLIKSGLIGTDFNSIYFTKIRTANVNVGLIDKIFGVGTINIDTGKVETVSNNRNRGNGISVGNDSVGTRTAYDKLLHIHAPYQVYKYFQTTMSGREEGLYSGRADRENMSGSNI